VFCRFSYADRLKVLRTPSVLSVVGFNGKPAALSDEEIGRIKRIVESGNPVAPWDLICVGQRVRIWEGAMSGVEGVLLREKSTYRVVVNIELLQRAVAVEVDRDCLRSLDSALSYSKIS
jgi:transcription antitermination factor NusG